MDSPPTNDLLMSDANNQYKCETMCTVDVDDIWTALDAADDCESSQIAEQLLVTNRRRISVVVTPILNKDHLVYPLEATIEPNPIPSLSKSFTVQRPRFSRIPAPLFRAMLRRERQAQADKHLRTVTFEKSGPEMRGRPQRDETRVASQIPVWSKRLKPNVNHNGGSDSFIRARSMKYSTYFNHHSADQCDNSRKSCIDFGTMNSILSIALVSGDELSNPESCKFIFDFIEREYKAPTNRANEVDPTDAANDLAGSLRTALRKRELARCFSTDSERQQCDNSVEYDWDYMFDKESEVY